MPKEHVEELEPQKDENQSKGSEGEPNDGGEELTPEQIKELLAERDALKSKASRLENESKDYKKKYQEKVTAEEALKRKKLEEEGKTEELLEEERKEKQRLREQLINTKTKAIRTKLENEILRLAPNCHDVNDVISNLNSEKYSIDTDSEVVSGVSDALEDVKKRKPYLFASKKMPNSYNGGTGGEPSHGKKILTYEEYLKLPTKKEMQEALSEGRVEGLN